jgi:hypothetical protein
MGLDLNEKVVDEDQNRLGWLELWGLCRLMMMVVVLVIIKHMPIQLV